MMESAKFSCNIPEKESYLFILIIRHLHLEYVLGDSRLLVKNILDGIKTINQMNISDRI